MRNNGSDEEGTADRPGASGPSIELALPIIDSELFTHEASPSILNFLSDNPEINVSIRQLSHVTPVTERSTREAVNTLENHGLVETFQQGKSRRVQVNRTRLHKPTDPIGSIPQPEFRTPVRLALNAIRDRLEDVQGVVLFGSVARGEADRQSDIDLWVLVADDHMHNRNEANKIARELKETRIPSTVALASDENDELTDKGALDANDGDEEQTPLPAHVDPIALETSDRGSDTGERYRFQIIVETPGSLLNQADRVEVDQLFGDGITLYTSETFENLKLELIENA